MLTLLFPESYEHLRQNVSYRLIKATTCSILPELRGTKCSVFTSGEVAPDGLEMMRMTREVTRRGLLGKKGVKKGRNEKKGGRGEWLPCRHMDGGEGQRSGSTENREKRWEGGKEGRKKGRPDSYFSSVASRVGCNPNPILPTHIVNSHSRVLRSGGRTTSRLRGILTSSYYIRRHRASPRFFLQHSCCSADGNLFFTPSSTRLARFILLIKRLIKLNATNWDRNRRAFHIREAVRKKKLILRIPREAASISPTGI